MRKRYKNGKKAYLVSVCNIATWLCHSLAGFRDNVSTVQRTETKEEVATETVM